jgi:hypothetical protein
MVASAGAPGDAWAQGAGVGSRNLPVDHWSSEYIRRLRSRGFLGNLNPLIQPYRRSEIALGLASIDPDTLPSPLASWVRLLREEFQRELNRIADHEVFPVGFQATLGARTSTSRRIDVTRPVGEGKIWRRQTGAVWVETGPFAAETRLKWDDHIDDDPDAVDIGQGKIGRTDNAYVSLAFPVGHVQLGRLAQNWSLADAQGLMVSHVAPTYPQVSLDLRAGRFRLRSVTGELETDTNAVTLDAQKRFLAGHRFDYQTENFVASFGEAVLYASSSGLQLRFLNPFEFLFANRSAVPADIEENVMLDAQVWYRWRGLEFFAEGMLDDIDVDPPAGEDRAPTRYGFFVQVRATGLLASAEVVLSYRQVSSFAYRTNRKVDKYLFLGLGLGDEFSDYDRLTAAVDFFPAVRGLRITPTLLLQRQGEGDLREPFPAVYEDFRASPALLLGVTEKTYRFALAGRYQPNRYVWMTWDAGHNVVRQADHVVGNNASDFTATAAFGLTLDLPLVRQP